MDELDRILVRFHPTQLMRDLGYYSTLKSNREAKAQLTAYVEKKEREAIINFLKSQDNVDRAIMLAELKRRV